MAQNDTSRLIEKRIHERAEAENVSAEELRILADAWACLHKNDVFEAMYSSTPPFLTSGVGGVGTKKEDSAGENGNGAGV